MNQPAPSPQVPNLRPNPLFADITLIESRARSKYERVAGQVHGSRWRTPCPRS